eukprot:11967011-Heterocapsa_arctica.AAC.1
MSKGLPASPAWPSSPATTAAITTSSSNKDPEVAPEDMPTIGALDDRAHSDGLKSFWQTAYLPVSQHSWQTNGKPG